MRTQGNIRDLILKKENQARKIKTNIEAIRVLIMLLYLNKCQVLRVETTFRETESCAKWPNIFQKDPN